MGRVAYGGGRIVPSRHGKPVVALVSTATPFGHRGTGSSAGRRLLLNLLQSTQGVGQAGATQWPSASSRSWGPADLDVVHCSTDLALLHSPAWGMRFAEAYEEAGRALATAASERLYWRARDGPAFSEEVQLVSQPWREAGRAELTTRAVEERLDA